MAILNASTFDTRGRARSFSWSHILFRALWNAAWLLLASWTPPQLHGWRALVLRAFGARIGPKARVYGSSRVWYPPNLKMGEGAILGPRANCYCMAETTIAAFAIVSQCAQLVSGSHDTEDPNFQLYTRPVYVGAHAWIAAGAFVGPGVTVGDGAVLGACAVSFKDLDAWTVYVGNPAKRIRQRRWPPALLSLHDDAAV